MVNIARASLGLLLLLGAAPAATGPTQPTEVTSEIADLARMRDLVYLRLDGLMPSAAGRAERGVKKITLRLEAMTRGRAWPGRWTMLEVEVRPSVVQDLMVGTANRTAPVRLTPGHWSSVRIPLPEKPEDVVLLATKGLAGSMDLQRVRLLDDRVTLCDEGWKVERANAIWRLAPRMGPPLLLSTDQFDVTEANTVRALVRRGERGAAVFATGRVSAEAGVGMESAGGSGTMRVGISDDFGRIDRNTAGDENGDGFNERRGATVLRVTGKRGSLTISPPEGADLVVRPALELMGLPEGSVSVLWEGKVVSSRERLADGTLLIEIPGEVRGSSRVDIAVDDR